MPEASCHLEISSCQGRKSFMSFSWRALDLCTWHPGICSLGFARTTALRSSAFPADFPGWQKNPKLMIDKYHAAEAFLSPSIIIRGVSIHHCAHSGKFLWQFFKVIHTHCLCRLLYIDIGVLCRRERVLNLISLLNSNFWNLGICILPSWFSSWDLRWIFASIFVLDDALFSLKPWCAGDTRGIYFLVTLGWNLPCKRKD